MSCYTLRRGFVLIAVLTAALTGCPRINIDEEALEDAEIRIFSPLAPVQVRDPRIDPLPAGFIASGGTIILEPEVEVITSITTEIIVEEVPDILLLAFENLTGFDAYIRYAVDGVVQGVFVFDGETLTLEYPCLQDVALLTEEHFDPVTGVLVEDFDLGGELFLEGIDYFCGDVFILSFTPFEIIATAEPLLP